MFKRFFISLLVILLLGSVYTLFRLDASTQAIDSELYPSVVSSTYTAKEPVVLLNYASGPEVFFKNQQALTASAVSRGFDMVLNMNRNLIDPTFYEANRHILDQKPGGGFWLWKPYFIYRAMQTLPDDTLIFYSDSGVVYTKPINKIKRLLEASDMVLVKHSHPTPLSQHLKREAYEALGIADDSPELQSENIWGFFIALRNNSKTRAFIKSWLDVCLNADAITNTPMDKNNQAANFQWHQHDQSLLSVLVAKDPDGKIVIPKREMRKEYGVHNFHRHQHRSDESPLFLSLGYHRYISEVFWNNALMRAIRRWFL